jgi:hypothetical protein
VPFQLRRLAILLTKSPKRSDLSHTLYFNSRLRWRLTMDSYKQIDYADLLYKIRKEYPGRLPSLGGVLTNQMSLTQ